MRQKVFLDDLRSRKSYKNLLLFTAFGGHLTHTHTSTSSIQKTEIFKNIMETICVCMYCLPMRRIPFVLMMGMRACQVFGTSPVLNVDSTLKSSTILMISSEKIE